MWHQLGAQVPHLHLTANYMKKKTCEAKQEYHANEAKIKLTYIFPYPAVIREHYCVFRKR
jgi:hypothetical protein